MIDKLAITNMALAMQNDSHTNKELAEESGMHIDTVYAWTKLWHEQGLIHITAWDRDKGGRPTVKVWKWGCHPDRPRPPRKTTKQVYEDRMLRKKHAILSQTAVRTQ